MKKGIVDLDYAEKNWQRAEIWLASWAARYDHGAKEGLLTEDRVIAYQVAVSSALFWSGLLEDGETLRDHLLPPGIANYR